MRYPKLRKRITPSVADLLLHQLREVATVVDDVPAVEVSSDPDDNWLFGLALAGNVEYIVSGDKRDVI